MAVEVGSMLSFSARGADGLMSANQNVSGNAVSVNQESRQPQRKCPDSAQKRR
jgi:hypothetical protein